MEKTEGVQGTEGTEAAVTVGRITLIRQKW